MVLLHWVVTPSPSNPEFVAAHSIEANTQITPEVAGILRRACMDCHSNQTRWPWCSRIPPICAQMHRDVSKARKAMNLSEWATKSGKRPELAIGALAAVCGDVQSGRMPLPMYVLLHPEARLSAADKAQLCTWTQSEMRRYVKLKREQAASRRSQIVYNSATTSTVATAYHGGKSVPSKEKGVNE